MSDPYVRAARALQALAPALVEGRAARFQAPPRVASRDPQPSNRATANPTLDVTLDERRWALSSEVAATEALLTHATETLNQARERLDAALAAWNNEGTDDEPR